MGRIEANTPLLEDFDNESVAYENRSGIFQGPRNQVPIADDGPPPYSDISTSTELPDRRYIEQSDFRDDVLNHQKYGILSTTTHRDGKGSKTTVISQSLASDPKLLRDFISSQTKLMPNPLVRMVGTHTETRRRRKSEESTIVTDFDISISASDLLAPAWRRTKVVENGMHAYRGGRWKTIAPGYKSDLESTHTAPRLEEWYHRFCASAASLKTYGHALSGLNGLRDLSEMLISMPYSFSLSYRIVNRDDRFLTDALHGVLRSTNYRGSISVTFPLEHRAITVMSDHPLNRYRTNSCIWWVCVILPLWIVTWPILWLMTKNWEVVSVDWPCRIYQRPDGGWPNSDEDIPSLIHEGISLAAPNTRGTDGIRVAVMSEAAWVESWRAAIVRAAESRTQGTLTASDRDATSAIEQRNAERDWEARQKFRTAHLGSVAEAALGFIRGASHTWRNTRMSRGWGANT